MFRRGQPQGSATPRLVSPRAGLWLLACLTFFPGCKSGTKTALIEAELRTREREIRTIRTELERANLLNSALQYELAQRGDACAPIVSEGVVIDGPQSVLAGTVTRVTLGRGTGGIDDDGIPGDEALQVVIVPVDTDGSALKVPGKVMVQAQEITPEGLKVPLCQWEVAPLELQRSWRSGLFSTGYFLTLPWKAWPSTEKMRVVVQFQTLPNNRMFEADRDIRIKPMGVRVPRPTSGPTTTPTAPPPSGPAPMLPAPPPAEVLPPPVDGPIWTPGAFRPEVKSPAAAAVQAAKPAPALPVSRVRLLTPVLPNETPGNP